ncbi:putative bifunctional diguanylate cyclase/phosphodiesterase [Paenibacillus sedimenti]|uniref:EAL domain-containing protein n=1 Tax=Paenibacillus sedimenti TaxID=2770274 RepID=A0A926KRG7_9BACL|nr:EAL domain-containing protein [Paenibacillus sedimenti]MBD0380864.1 EAL domain-containing protein [Paenibacillus sedimenti]
MDPLTQLPNRILFFERLAEALEQSTRCGTYAAVLFIDLDNFKTINDTYGHENGDRVLQEIARRLRDLEEEGHLVSRLGGDEFTVLLKDITEPDIIREITSRIHKALSSHVLLEGRQVEVSASTGVSVFPLDGDDPETLVKNADVAMFQVKQEGKNNVFEYSLKKREEHARNALLERHLRTAVPNGELLLLYQPKLDLRAFETVGVEALLRWNHPTLGMIPPDEFIPLAERKGIIVDIGKWVLHRACSDIKALQQKGFASLHVAVNLSVIQLEKDDIVPVIADVLHLTGPAPRYLEIEITESAVMSKVEAVIEKLHALRDLKVSVAIDDFGTGYSSLSYLKRFPLSSLKVDKCFVHELGTQKADKTIAKAIIDLGHNLGLRVVAEGVETKEQLEILTAQECDEIQGYYISKPLELDNLEQFLLQKTDNETRSR